MNTRNLLLTGALAMTAAGGAFAQEATVEPMVPATSVVTRAEVQAQAIRALHNGRLTEHAALMPTIRAESAVTREAVEAATLRAIASGAVDRIDAEAYRFLG